MPPLAKHFKLSSGALMPSLGLGTWRSEPGKVRAAVSTAIGAGYRHIDCAWIYGNEAEVGQGIKDGGINRDELWLTSKLWNSFHHPENVEATLDETLKNLGVSFLDLYLMHWPTAFGLQDGKAVRQPKDSNGNLIIDHQLSEDHSSTWQAMEALVDKGKVKNIGMFADWYDKESLNTEPPDPGISNFNIRRTKKLLQSANIKPAANQVELSYSNPQPELVAWLNENDILPQAYSPLGSKGAGQREEPIVVEIAKELGVDPANVLISWQIQRGAACLPKSVTPERIKSNFQTVEIPEEAFQKLEKAATSKPGQRVVDPDWAVGVFEDDDPKKSDKAQYGTS